MVASNGLKRSRSTSAASPIGAHSGSMRRHGRVRTVDRRRHRRPDRARAALRDGGGGDPRPPDADLEERPAVAPSRAGEQPLHGDADFLVYEDEHLSFEQHFRAAATLAHGWSTSTACAPAMRGDHAQLPRVVDRVLGRRIGERGGRPPQRLVDGTRARVRPGRLRIDRAVLRRGAAERLADHLPGLEALRTTIVAKVEPGTALPARRSPSRMRSVPSTPMPSCWTSPSTPRTTPRSSTPRAPQGVRRGARHAAQHLHQPAVARVLAGPQRAEHARGLAAARPGRSQRLPAVRAVLPRHGLPFDPPEPGLRREDRHHAQGRRPGAGAHRAGAGDDLRWCPGHGLAGPEHPDFAERDISSVRSIGYGGAPAAPELVRRIEALFPGRTPSNGYGLTETSSVTTLNVGADYVRKPTPSAYRCPSWT